MMDKINLTCLYALQLVHPHCAVEIMYAQEIAQSLQNSIVNRVVYCDYMNADWTMQQLYPINRTVTTVMFNIPCDTTQTGTKKKNTEL
jgi:hypothetical protein